MIGRASPRHGRLSRSTGPLPGAAATFAAALLLLPGLVADRAAAATLELTGPAGATVSLDGRPLGTFPLPGPLELEPGLHLVRSELPGHERYRAELLLNDEDERVHWHVRPSPLRRRTAVVSNLLLAGSGQRYVGRQTLGWVLTGAEVGGLLTALLGELSVQNHRDDYLLLRDRYGAAVAPAEIELYRRLAAEALADAESAQRRRNAGLAVAGAAVVASVLDVLLRFPGIAGAGEVPFASAEAPSGRPAAGSAAGAGAAVHAGIALRF